MTHAPRETIYEWLSKYTTLHVAVAMVVALGVEWQVGSESDTTANTPPRSPHLTFFFFELAAKAQLLWVGQGQGR